MERGKRGLYKLNKSFSLVTSRSRIVFLLDLRDFIAASLIISSILVFSALIPLVPRWISSVLASLWAADWFKRFAIAFGYLSDPIKIKKRRHPTP
jgi:hypothetical protein